MVWLIGAVIVGVMVAGFVYLRPQWLAHAIADGDRGAVERLLRWGAPLDPPAAWGTTPLETAAINQQPEILELLLESGAQLPADGGDRALRAAVMAGSPGMVQRLLHAGAKPSPAAVIGTLAVCYAAAQEGDEKLGASAVTCATLLWPHCPADWPREPFLVHAEQLAQQGHPALRDAMRRLAAT